MPHCQLPYKCRQSPLPPAIFSRFLCGFSSQKIIFQSLPDSRKTQIRITPPMKKTGLFAASVAAAASATALSAPPSSTTSSSSFQDINFPQQEKRDEENSSRRSQSTDQFAPRFDGLRFIETLVTAHR